jgi:hypothetical protein
MNNPDNTWSFLRDCGLCGSGPPGGVILRFVLEVINTHYAHEKQEGDALLKLVQSLQQRLPPDNAGFQGCLLELEFILKCKQGMSLSAILMTSKKKEWVSGKVEILLGSVPTVVAYNEANKSLSGHGDLNGWHILDLPVGFCVFDCLLINNCSEGGGGGGAAEVFGVQVTISKNPFSKHSTHETCSEKSKRRLAALEQAVCTVFKSVKPLVYVIHAPKAIASSIAAPSKHTSPYYVSPGEIVCGKETKHRSDKPSAKVQGKKRKV